jgi:hypothetical protein
MPFAFTLRIHCRSSHLQDGGAYREKEVELYLALLTCMLFIFEDLPMTVLNSILLSQARSFDTSYAVASFAFSVFQLGRKSAFFAKVLDLKSRAKKADVKLGHSSKLFSFLIFAVEFMQRSFQLTAWFTPAGAVGGCMDYLLGHLMNDKKKPRPRSSNRDGDEDDTNKADQKTADKIRNRNTTKVLV